jgi:hypothetical protein
MFIFKKCADLKMFKFKKRSNLKRRSILKISNLKIVQILENKTKTRRNQKPRNMQTGK